MVFFPFMYSDARESPMACAFMMRSMLADQPNLEVTSTQGVYMKGKKTMEINPTSPVILDLKAKQAAGDACASATAALLFDTALLTSGFTIDQPAEFAAKIFALMDKAVDAAPAPAAEKQEKKDDDEPKAEAVDAEVV